MSTVQRPEHTSPRCLQRRSASATAGRTGRRGSEPRATKDHPSFPVILVTSLLLSMAGHVAMATASTPAASSFRYTEPAR